MKKVRKNGLSGATAIVTPLIFLMSLATRRFWLSLFCCQKRPAHKNSQNSLKKQKNM